MHRAVPGEQNPVHSRALSHETQQSSQHVLGHLCRRRADTGLPPWGPCRTSPCPHPHTSAPASAEQHHPQKLVQCLLAKGVWLGIKCGLQAAHRITGTLTVHLLGATRAASAADTRSHGVFPTCLCLLLTPCNSFCLPSQGPGAHCPSVPAASHPTQGRRQAAEHLHTGENTTRVTRVFSCRYLEKPC